MRLVYRSSSAGDVAELILGVGIVGEQVVSAVKLLPGGVPLDDRLVPTQWDDLVASLEQASAALKARPPSRTRVFWCAGRAGFGSDAVECEGEMANFRLALRWAESLNGPLEFHLSSSAGGLHEGQVLVSAPEPVTTVRPYAALKLQQEQALAASKLTAQFVYRISSVYGPPSPGRRLGLISALVLNTLRHRPTLITAHASTQRDFVSAGDVGRFMASEAKSPGLHYLISGTPLSIWALQLAVERTFQRPVSVVYSLQKDNVASTSFLPSLKPAHWDASSVESNLPRIAQAAQSWAR